MRLLFLNYEYPPLGGGAANATQHLLREFANYHRYSIDLICSSVNEDSLEMPFDQTRIFRLDIGKHGDLHYQTQENLIHYALRARRRAAMLHRQEPYDGCLAFFGIPCGVLARGLGIPYIVSLRGSDVPFYNPRFALLDRLFFQRMSRKVWADAHAVVANSAGLRSLALESAPGQAISVIPNGVDTRTFYPADSLPPTFEILTVARLIPRKGLNHLINALALLPDYCSLTIIGSGTEGDALKKQARDLQIEDRVRFLGAMPHEWLPKHYRAASVFVLPSLNEGMSNTVLEAMASGLPVVLTRTGGTDELLTDGENGFAIEQGNATDIVRALRQYLKDDTLLQRHGAESRKRAEAQSWATAAGDYAELFDRYFRKPARG